MYKYAGLTKLVYYAGTGEAGLLDLGSLVRHIGPGYGQTAISGIQKSTKGSHPYNQGEILPSIEEDHGDRVHSGGLPTITVSKYSPYLTVVRSQSKRYKV
jgi:hypothetical protein